MSGIEQATVTVESLIENSSERIKTVLLEACKIAITEIIARGKPIPCSINAEFARTEVTITLKVPNAKPIQTPVE